MSDNDAIDFLKRCRKALKQNGIIIFKDNIASKNTEFEPTDSSWIRTRQAYIDIIHKSGLNLIKDDKQLNLPSDVYDVILFAVK